MRTSTLTRSAMLLALAVASGAAGAANAFVNAGFETTGMLGPSVTYNTVGSGGQSAADQWLQFMVSGSNFTTSLDTSSDTLLPQSQRGNMLILTSDGPMAGGSTGNGVGQNLLGLLPLHSTGTIDIKVVSGTVWLGFVDSINCCTFFDSGGSGIISGTGDWQRVSFANNDFATGAFEIQVHAPAGGLAVLYVDNAQAQAAPVPEPAGWALALAGVGVLGWVRARRSAG